MQDSWAICRIFKKTNSSAQRALSQSWVSPLPESNNTTATDAQAKCSYNAQFSSENLSLSTAKNSSSIQFNYNYDLRQPSSSATTATFSPLDFLPYKTINPMISKPNQLPISTGDLTANFIFSPFEPAIPAKCHIDLSSMLLNESSTMLGDFGKASECIDFGGSQDQCSDFSTTTTGLPNEMQLVNISNGSDHENVSIKHQNMMQNFDAQWENTVRSIGFPFSLPMSMAETWKPNSLWDPSSCPSEMSSTVSTTKCYT